MESNRTGGKRVPSFKSVALPAVLALALGGLAACSSGGGEASANFKASAACPAQATLTAWLNASDAAQTQIEAGAVTNYEKLCPGITISVQYYSSSDIEQKLTAALAAGNPPTMFETSGPGVTQYDSDGHLVDLSTGLSSANGQWESEVLPSSLTAQTVDGKLYGFPMDVPGPVGIFYSKSAFKKAGIAAPPTTLTEFQADVKKVQAAGYIPVALGDESKYPSTYWLQYLTDRVGGTAPFQAVLAGKANAWSNPAIETALTELRSLATAGTFGAGFDSVSTLNSADKALLYTGKAAMTLNGSFILGAIESGNPSMLTDNDLGFASFPSQSAGTSAADIYGLSSEVLSVTSASAKAQQEDAEAFLATEWTTKKVANELINIGGVPAVSGVETNFPDTNAGSISKTAYDEATQHASTFETNWYYDLGTVDQTLAQNTAAVTDGSMSVAAFVKAMNATLTPQS